MMPEASITFHKAKRMRRRWSNSQTPKALPWADE
jgi:hypothetical protein